MKQRTINKVQRITKLANDIKELLQLDECQAVLLPGEAWLRMKSGAYALDCPIGTKPLFDKKHDNMDAIKTAVIQLWIGYLENEQRNMARAVLSG